MEVAIELLDETLEEKKAADEKPSEFAFAGLNQQGRRG